MDTNSLGGRVLLQFILTYCLCGVRSCTVDVKQDEFCEAFRDNKSANISCQYKGTNCPGREKIFWLRYLESTYEEIDPTNIKFGVKINNGHALLTINNIDVQDSGIYICVVVFPKNPHLTATGGGTMVIIRDKPEVIVTPTNTALIVLCTLLLIYCVAVFSYYSFKSKWKLWDFIRAKPGVRAEANRRPRSVFQAIAAEYHKRYDPKIRQNQDIEDDRIYQNTQHLPQTR
ncbi:hypothetical protein GDO81_016876 [Engystomops pustulosus]|uniref:Ig-like domain-containing protein n=1 Tax=Engystomops pustulosus TaxID=76066 RepID=A0AAV7ADU1_ENGPU|nr:hypothetical protein GDO81_016876 [Engystomops pustulosus]